MLSVGIVVALVAAVIIVAVLQHRRERRDQAFAERLKRSAELHQHSPQVRSHREPAAKGFTRPGGGTAA